MAVAFGDVCCPSNDFARDDDWRCIACWPDNGCHPGLRRLHDFFRHRERHDGIHHFEQQHQKHSHDLIQRDDLQHEHGSFCDDAVERRLQLAESECNVDAEGASSHQGFNQKISPSSLPGGTHQSGDFRRFLAGGDYYFSHTWNLNWSY